MSKERNIIPLLVVMAKCILILMEKQGLNSSWTNGESHFISYRELKDEIEKCLEMK